MNAKVEANDPLAMDYCPEQGTRTIAGTSVVIHCHHYNARLQETIKTALGDEGAAMITDLSAAVFAEQLARLLGTEESDEDKWRLAAELYANLGYGCFDPAQAVRGVFTARASHFVEGYAAAFPDVATPVCHLATGFLEAAHFVITGRPLALQEESCVLAGGSECRFVPSKTRDGTPQHIDRSTSLPTGTCDQTRVASANIDDQKIIDTLVTLPFVGNEDGLIPAFGVYLAKTPADLYNLLSIRFVEAMEKRHLGSIAAAQLVEVAEICGMNTFRGIISSPEWEGLVGPMLKRPEDVLYGIIAVSNALGWGHWHVSEHTPGESLSLFSENGYESVGYRALRGQSKQPCCWMYRGVAAGIMELVYGVGTVSDRYGQFASSEDTCGCTGDSSCSFAVEVNA